jgi:hypothetical protein
VKAKTREWRLLPTALTALAAVAAVAATAVCDASAAGSHPLTCAHHGRRIGCLRRDGPDAWGSVSPCNVMLTGNSRWIWGDEGLSGHMAHAALIAPGVWRVADVGSHKPDGYVIRRGADRWRIVDAKSTLVADAYGPDGPAVGLLLLYWGWGWQCFPR